MHFGSDLFPGPGLKEASGQLLPYLRRFLLLSLLLRDLLDGALRRALTARSALRVRSFLDLRAQRRQVLAEHLPLVLFRRSDSVDDPAAGLDLTTQQRERLLEKREDVRRRLRVHSAFEAYVEVVRFEAAVDRFLNSTGDARMEDRKILPLESRATARGRWRRCGVLKRIL